MKRAQGLKALLVIMLIVIIFWPAFQWMVDRWRAPDSYYSHGFLIPFVSLYVLWRARRFFTPVPALRSHALGYGIIGSAVLLHMVSVFWRIYFTQAFAFLLLLFGLVFLFYGFKASKPFLFGLGFLIFMIPLPLDTIASLNLKLKMFAAEQAVGVVKAFGVHCVRDGSHIHFLNCSLTVGNVCSGLRSLISLLALGTLFAYLSKGNVFKKSLIVIMSFPIAIVANVVRIVLLCLIANRWGSEIATGFFHDFSGLLLFVIAYLLLFALESLCDLSRFRRIFHPIS